MRIVGLVLLTAFFASVVFAVPPFPHQLYGVVEVNNASAPDGTLVIAKVNGTEFGRTSTSGGKYGYSPVFTVPADDPATPAREGARDGEMISLFVRNDTLLVTTVQFGSGAVTNMRLDADYEVPCSDECSSLGVRSCSGKRRYRECGNWDADACVEDREVACEVGQVCKDGACIVPEPPACVDDCQFGQTRCASGLVESCGNVDVDPCTDWGSPAACPADQSCQAGACVAAGVPVACVESWLCDAWGPCVGGLQTRGCTDFNACGTVAFRPALSRACEVAPSGAPCVESWDCSSFGPCVDGYQSRSCLDRNACGTMNARPEVVVPCEVLPSVEEPTHVPAEREVSTFVWLVAALVVIVILVGGATYVLHERAKHAAEVEAYVSQMRQRKYSDALIRAALERSGWPKDVVGHALKKAK